MKAIYVRISTANQNIERQLKKDKSIIAYIDVCSGAVPFAERENAKKLMRNKSITEIEVVHVDRLGRNLKDILNTVDFFTSKGIDIRIEKLGINLLVNGEITPTGNLIISMFGAVAQLEKDIMKERTSEGIAIAKSKGMYKGRKRGANTDIKKNKEDLIRLVQSKLDDKLSIKSIAETTKGITRPTIYSYIKKGFLVVN